MKKRLDQGSIECAEILHKIISKRVKKYWSAERITHMFLAQQESLAANAMIDKFDKYNFDMLLFNSYNDFRQLGYVLIRNNIEISRDKEIEFIKSKVENSIIC